MITSQEIISIFNNFINKCNEITKDNIYYKVSYIKGICNRYIISLKNHKYESIAYNFANISDICEKVTTQNYLDYIAEIKNLCIRMISYINKYGLE